MAILARDVSSFLVAATACQRHADAKETEKAEATEAKEAAPRMKFGTNGGSYLTLDRPHSSRDGVCWLMYSSTQANYAAADLQAAFDEELAAGISAAVAERDKRIADLVRQLAEKPLPATGAKRWTVFEADEETYDLQCDGKPVLCDPAYEAYLMFNEYSDRAIPQAVADFLNSVMPPLASAPAPLPASDGPYDVTEWSNGNWWVTVGKDAQPFIPLGKNEASARTIKDTLNAAYALTRKA
jgi:hypothetical protein